MFIEKIAIQAPQKGLFEITDKISKLVEKSQVKDGLCTLFIQHTSASLLIQENADMAARQDLQNWFSRLVVEGDELYTHTSEGLDDMPGHIKSTLTATHLSIPIMNSKLTLGTWQGVFLWEHRRNSSARSIVVHIN